MLRTLYNVQKKEWIVDELISTLTQREQTTKKGKGLLVQHVSHKIAEKKKEEGSLEREKC